MSESPVAVTSRPSGTDLRNENTDTSLEWVLARLPYEVFWLHEIPGDTRANRTLMSRLVKDKDSGVVRLQREFYMKGEWCPPRPKFGNPDGFWLLSPRNTHDRLYTVARYLGDSYAGFGLAGYDALSVFHWTEQCPIRTSLAIARRDLPSSPLPNQVMFRPRSNERRLKLTVAENTIIEAARANYLVEIPLKRCLAEFKDPAMALHVMKLYIPEEMIVVRPEVLAWGVEAEHSQPAKVKEIVMAVADILEDNVVYTDIARW